jgi:hypothetical protein
MYRIMQKSRNFGIQCLANGDKIHYEVTMYTSWVTLESLRMEQFFIYVKLFCKIFDVG